MPIANLVRRGFRPNRVRDSQHIAGRKFGMLTAIEHVGFAKTMAVWKFRCDCGNEVEARSSHIVWAAKHPKNPTSRQRLHCGCQSMRAGLISKLPGYDYWQRYFGLLCDAWQESCQAFNSECFALRTAETPHLVRPDSDQPIGPGNFLWSRQEQSTFDLYREITAILVSRGRTPEQAAEWISSVSRQRLWQVRNKAHGLCPQCGEPMEQTTRGGVKRQRRASCESCALKERERST